MDSHVTPRQGWDLLPGDIVINQNVNVDWDNEWSGLIVAVDVDACGRRWATFLAMVVKGQISRKRVRDILSREDGWTVRVFR